MLITTGAEPQVPCYFIFGDSLVDNGNNNNLVTEAKVNYPPYGVDFPGGEATGRFSNGENTADIIGLCCKLLSTRKKKTSEKYNKTIHISGKLLGFTNYTPPHATASGRGIVKGMNYGSGGAGILTETGRNLVN